MIGNSMYIIYINVSFKIKILKIKYNIYFDTININKLLKFQINVLYTATIIINP